MCTIGWNRKTDTFEVGQWMRGRIYEKRCDLSPDGKHFIYFAMNGKWSTKVKGSWTAISRAPFLKATGLWANGSCWNGGGLFMSNSEFWLNSCIYADEEEQLTPPKLRKREGFPFQANFGGECPGVYYHQLQRDGWRLLRDAPDSRTDGYTVFEKPLPKGWVLEKIAHATIDHPIGKGCYFDTHRLTHRQRQIRLDRPDWEWADLDRNRLVWVENGVLFTAPITSKGTGQTRQLFDFNPMKFEAIAAPY